MLVKLPLKLLLDYSKLALLTIELFCDVFGLLSDVDLLQLADLDLGAHIVQLVVLFLLVGLTDPVQLAQVSVQLMHRIIVLFLSLLDLVL